MARYVTRPKADDDYWPETAPFITSLTVSDHEAADTGLLDADGNTIWRLPNPIGFGRDDEW